MPIELTRTLTFRLGPELYARLEMAAELYHMSLSELVRQRLQGIELRPRRRAVADEELLRQLVRIGSNLNQAVHALHLMRHKGLAPQTEVLTEALQATRTMLERVSRRVEEVSR